MTRNEFIAKAALGLRLKFDEPFIDCIVEVERWADALEEKWVQPWVKRCNCLECKHGTYDEATGKKLVKYCNCEEELSGHPRCPRCKLPTSIGSRGIGGNLKFQ